jgi:hypothetical protein
MPSLRAPILWVLIAGVHVVAAAYAWRMLPHGFDVGHPRFWTNQVLPFAVVAAAVTCVFALWQRRARIAALAIGAFAGLHVGMAVAWAVVFPITGKRIALVSAVIAIVACTCALASLRRATGMRLHLAIGAVLGLLVGAFVPWSQRGADPQTHPAEHARELARPESGTLPSWVRVSPENATLALELEPLYIELQPLLTFYSRSPDRGWTVLASDAHRIGPQRRYASDTTYQYTGDEPATLAISSDDVLHVDAETVLPTAVYSHLNSFCVMSVRGHRRLFLAFSPMPEQRIEVMYSQYPVGKPSRFAYLDAASVFHVVQAESGEKGPFTELARGPLPAGANLGITLYDEDKPIASLELADFAAQASTQTSPTAGWGVPENAIEFSLTRDRPDAMAVIYMTLAGTSVGRGFDSVGHAPGLYRNRIEVRRLR